MSSIYVSLSSGAPNWKQRESNNEPISVLDTRRSPSPSTSISGDLPATLPAVSGETQLPIEVAGAGDWDDLWWISNELIQGDAANPNLFEIPNLVPQVSNFTVYPNETLDEKPQFFNPFPPNLLIPPDPSEPLSLHHQPALKRPNLGSFENSENFISHPQVPENYKQTPFAQTLANPLSPTQNPPLKRPNLGSLATSGNFISPPQVSKPYKQPPFAQTLVSHPHQDPPPSLKNPSFGNFGSLGSFDSHPEFPELDKQPPPETLALVPQQVVYDQLYKASELILSGNISNAHSILARLNHQLTPGNKPFQRASFYLKEALFQLISSSPSLLLKSPTPVDGLFKMGAYKLLSEVSPFTHFVNFTSNQAILEAVGDSHRVHVIDFDIGSGAQWASFMAELPIRGRTTNKGNPCLKITAFASPLTHHPFELGLMHENLTQFAVETGVDFELEVVNLDGFDPISYPLHLFKTQDKETTLAVNLPMWAFSNRLAAFPSIVRFVKQLSPKIVVTMDRGCERSDLPFSHHLLHALQYYEALLESIDASNTDSETVSKIEKFVVQPRMESIVLGRVGYPDQMPHWRALFAAAGFSQASLSSFAEIQAECVLAKTQVRGFNVERRQASLVLTWQRRELVTASAWRC